MPTTTTPNGRVRIGRVKFDATYRHTRGMWDNRDQQAAYFLGECTRDLGNNYVFIRKNNSIRVEGNVEDFYTYNYCMYKNANYSDRWFYCFIEDVVYINENVTELVITTDVIQTWWFDVNFGDCMLERVHEGVDYPGSNLIPEPEFGFDTIAENREYDRLFDNEEMDVIVLSANAPTWNTDAPWDNIPILETFLDGSVSVSGGKYNHIFSGCKAFVFRSSREINVLLPKFFEGLNKGGAAEAIVGVFMFPSAYMPQVVQEQIENITYDVVATDTDPTWIDNYAPKPTSLDGYVPYNKKLFTYPYCFMQMDDNNGHLAQYRYEFWGETLDADHVGEVKFATTVPFDADATVFVVPVDYNGIDLNVTQAFTFPFNTQCSWSYSAYKNWLSQNAFSVLVSAGATVLGFAFPAAKALGFASKGLSYGMKASKVGKHGIIKKGAAAGMGRTELQQASELNSMAAKLNMAASVRNATFGIGLGAEVNRMMHQPDVVKSQASGNSLFCENFMTYNWCQMSIRRQFARQIDMFFQQFGYAYDTVGNVKSFVKTRESWNYIKTSGCYVKGNIPAEDATLIEDILDSGITFWHDDDIGNYKRVNRMIV